MIKDIILCRCHRQPVRTKIVKSKYFGNEKKYYCSVKGNQLFNNFIHAKAEVKLRDPDETWDGSESKCPEDLEEALVDYKKKASGE